MNSPLKRLEDKGVRRGGRGAALPVLVVGLTFLLTSCLPAMQAPTTLAPPLPKVETLPPANFTKGAPAYTMLFHTSTSSMPGAIGLMGGNGDNRMVNLRMVSHPGPAGGASPKAYHMIPPEMRMGDYLPLLPPVRETATPSRPERTPVEKPERMVIKIYWGCGDNVRSGQPKVIDTGKMKNYEFPGMTDGAEAVRNARGQGSGASSGLKPGWVEVAWPNREDSRTVPSGASLVGGHFIHGNFLPHIRFSMDAQHDIMEKLAISAESQSLKDAIPITWKKLPTAIGYHLMAMGYYEARKELVIWTSSENPNVNVGGQFLDTPQVRKHIASKVIMPADRDRCVIPKGIFDGADMVMVSGTAWGDDYWASEPPRPTKAPKNWKPDWVVKGQFLSTGSLMLGAPAGGAGGAGGMAPGAPGMGSILRGLF